MSLSSTPSTIPRLFALVFGLLFLTELDNCAIATYSASSSLNSEMSVTNHMHGERVLGSESLSPGEFSFFTQWGGCGATLIWEDILLTSARCDVIEDNTVIIGSHVSHQQEGDSVKRNIVSRHKHPMYDPNTLMYNYMILKLDKKVDTLPHVWIDPTVDIPTDAELFVVGFGFTASRIRINHDYKNTFHHTVIDSSEVLRYGNDDGPTSRMQGSVLQKIEATIVPHATCDANDQYAGFINDEKMICASNEDGACLGDNGGPLCMMTNNECLLIGIVSFGESCAMEYRPGVYSRISAVSRWIENEICTLSKNPPSSCPTQSTSQEPINDSEPAEAPIKIEGRFSIFEPSESNDTEITSAQPSTINEYNSTFTPSSYVSNFPSVTPSVAPIDTPSTNPSVAPSPSPSRQPSVPPSEQPIDIPSSLPSVAASPSPSVALSVTPSITPSITPIDQPSTEPSFVLSPSPSVATSFAPSVTPIDQPSIEPSFVFSPSPSFATSFAPSVTPIDQPSTEPSVAHSVAPSIAPIDQPSTEPSVTPSYSLSGKPSSMPSVTPIKQSSTEPSVEPNFAPNVTPISQPSTKPSIAPSYSPSEEPSSMPNFTPINQSSISLSGQPSATPSVSKSIPNTVLSTTTFPSPNVFNSSAPFSNLSPKDQKYTELESPSPLIILPPKTDPSDEFLSITRNFSATGEDYASMINSRREEEIDTEREEDDNNSRSEALLMPSRYPHAEDTVVATIRELSDHQNDRNLIQQPDFNFTIMPIKFFSFPRFDYSSRLEPRLDPDGTHLFFWPSGSPKTKLGICEGDCNSDEDCEEGLFCFMKDETITSVPGCVGFDTSRTDFCTNKNSSLDEGSPESTSTISDFTKINEISALPMLSPKKLELCEGDCDSDDDCAEDLYCFIKDTSVLSVPGCNGFDTSRTDYCTYKNITTSSSSAPLANYSSSSITLSNSTELPLLFAYIENPPNISSLPLQLCQGDCDSDTDCANELICYMKPLNESLVPGCAGISITRTDFCIDPNALIVVPSVSNLAMPIDFESAHPTFAPTELVTVRSSSTDTAVSTELRTSQLPSVSSSQMSADPTFIPTELLTSVSTSVSSGIIYLDPSPVPTQMPSLQPTSVPSSIIALDPTFIPIGKFPPTDILTTEKTISTGPEFVPEPPMNITIAIYFDPWPDELSWKLESDADGLVAIVPKGTYITQDQTVELVTVIPGGNYTFTIEDSGNDGIAGIGILYEIFITDQQEIILLKGDGVFKDSRNTTFYVPTIDEYPTSAPSELTLSPAPTVNTVSVFLIIIFDHWQQETSWTITEVNNPNLVYEEAVYDTYRAGESITEEIQLPSGQAYIFIIEDFFNDGIEDGEYLMMTDDGTILFEGDGSFGASRSHTFTLPDDDS